MLERGSVQTHPWFFACIKKGPYWGCFAICLFQSKIKQYFVVSEIKKNDFPKFYLILYLFSQCLFVLCYTLMAAGKLKNLDSSPSESPSHSSIGSNCSVDCMHSPRKARRQIQSASLHTALENCQPRTRYSTSLHLILMLSQFLFSSCFNSEWQIMKRWYCESFHVAWLHM